MTYLYPLTVRRRLRPHQEKIEKIGRKNCPTDYRQQRIAKIVQRQPEVAVGQGPLLHCSQRLQTPMRVMVEDTRREEELVLNLIMTARALPNANDPFQNRYTRGNDPDIERRSADRATN